MPFESLLEFVRQVDNFPYPDSSSDAKDDLFSNLYTFQVVNHPFPLGYVLPSIVSAFAFSPTVWSIDHKARTLTYGGGTDNQLASMPWDCNHTFSSANPTGPFSAPLAQDIAIARQQKLFKVLEGWRDEPYPVYSPQTGELILSLERSASGLFGIITYGIHLTAYTYTDTTASASANKAKHVQKDLRIWVPRRSKTKQKYAGMLDNTVGGGLATGESPFSCLVREAYEEASLPPDVVQPNTKAAGTVTYFGFRDATAGGETGLCQPECEYVFDLELPSAKISTDNDEQSTAIIPKPHDGEAEDFKLMGVEDVVDRILNGEFRPGSAMVIIDFLVRHGVLTCERLGMAAYGELTERLHRRLRFGK